MCAAEERPTGEKWTEVAASYWRLPERRMRRLRATAGVVQMARKFGSKDPFGKLARKAAKHGSTFTRDSHHPSNDLDDGGAELQSEAFASFRIHQGVLAEIAEAAENDADDRLGKDADGAAKQEMDEEAQLANITTEFDRHSRRFAQCAIDTLAPVDDFKKQCCPAIRFASVPRYGPAQREVDFNYVEVSAGASEKATTGAFHNCGVLQESILDWRKGHMPICHDKLPKLKVKTQKKECDQARRCVCKGYRKRGTCPPTIHQCI